MQYEPVRFDFNNLKVSKDLDHSTAHNGSIKKREDLRRSSRRQQSLRKVRLDVLRRAQRRHANATMPITLLLHEPRSLKAVPRFLRTNQRTDRIKTRTQNQNRLRSPESRV